MHTSPLSARPGRPPREGVPAEAVGLSADRPCPPRASICGWTCRRISSMCVDSRVSLGFDVRVIHRTAVFTLARVEHYMPQSALAGLQRWCL